MSPESERKVHERAACDSNTSEASESPSLEPPAYSLAMFAKWPAEKRSDKSLPKEDKRVYLS